MRLWADILQARGSAQYIKSIKEGIFQLLLYLEKLLVRTEEEIMGFPDKKKLKEFITTKLPSKKCYRDLIKLKRKDSK